MEIQLQEIWKFKTTCQYDQSFTSSVVKDRIQLEEIKTQPDRGQRAVEFRFSIRYNREKREF